MKTVYVLGAGASKEAGLPIGAELKSEIAGLLAFVRTSGRTTNGDNNIYEALKLAFQTLPRPVDDFQLLVSAARQISGSMPLAQSIDNFIDGHQGNKAIEISGKLAIVSAILSAEANSKLYFDRRNGATTPNFSAIEGTWYTQLFGMLVENCRASQIAERLASTSFIVFNYDRCLEQFLQHALYSYFNLEYSYSARLVGALEILHPYGLVGDIGHNPASTQVGFGASLEPPLLLEVAKEIRTFTEGTDPNSSDIIRIRQSLSEADRVCFLGFAFHPLNMDLLFPRKSKRNDPADRTKDVYATAFGMSESDAHLVRSELAYRLETERDYVRVRTDKICVDLLREYGRSLSFV